MTEAQGKLIFALVFINFLFSLAFIIGQKPVEYLPCEKYGMKEAKIVLIDANKVTYVCDK